MSFISKSGADFLEESNAISYLKSDGKCNKARATNWIERNGIPEELSESSCYSVKSPFSIEEKFFLNLPDAIERAESINNSILYQYKGKDKKVVYDEEQSDADMIANFMMYDSDDDCNWLIDTDGDHYTICHSDLDTEEQWSSSWDWLMPVVRTICTDSKYNSWHATDLERLDFYNARDYLAMIVCHGQLDDVYQAVIKFIKHWNDGKGNV